MGACSAGSLSLFREDEDVTDHFIHHRSELPDGSEIESSLDHQDDRLRLNIRLIGRDGFIIAAHRLIASVAALLTAKEILPKEFADDPEIQEAACDHVEEIWRRRAEFFGFGDPLPIPKDETRR
jgi:hypothetical protein